MLEVEYVFIDLVYYFVFIVGIFYVWVCEFGKLLELLCCFNVLVGVVKCLVVNDKKKIIGEENVCLNFNVFK